ncbi:hypothetical protein CEUSTIGMA_g3557.t1 [Chlamydomonas eustigma]|uniref:Guanylate cyclase domain-containing protein n=1 Tax=Chlamydomonas eustigma TaxID=1157962 RepID=A0A250WZ40_9CHLO|nr:hypothetical protein CEUSTIGMA_g3557.t1 [Chlamydomonas eustigma]|eukprot:GAX76114.1 hypothetical protein CEUSTIGMA_g3557.t1 [Chlamydomonas eustigma]
MFLCCFRDTGGPPPGSNSKPAHEETLSLSNTKDIKEVSTSVSWTTDISIFPVAIFQIDAKQRCKEITRLTFSNDEQISSVITAGRPRIVCMLHPEGLLTAPICLPHPVKAKCDSNVTPWLRADVVFADSTVQAAWATRNMHEVSFKLATCCKNDPAFAQYLSEAAVSVTTVPVQKDLKTKQRLQSHQLDILQFPRGNNIIIYSAYLRQSDVGTLCPALILELEGLALDQDSGPASSAPGRQDEILGLEHCGQAVHQPIAKPLVSSTVGMHGPLEASTTAYTDMRTKRHQQRELMRGRAMITAVPCIATLIELVQPGKEVESRNRMSQNPTSLREAAATNGQTIDQIGLITGRILLQNELSLAFWGKLSASDPSISGALLEVLFKEEPDAREGLMQQLYIQRLQQQLLPDQVLVSSPWKKVVLVPPLCKSLGGLLRRRKMQSDRIRGQNMVGDSLSGDPGSGSGRKQVTRESASGPSAEDEVLRDSGQDNSAYWLLKSLLKENRQIDTIPPTMLPSVPKAQDKPVDSHADACLFMEQPASATSSATTALQTPMLAPTLKSVASSASRLDQVTPQRTKVAYRSASGSNMSERNKGRHVAFQLEEVTEQPGASMEKSPCRLSEDGCSYSEALLGRVDNPNFVTLSGSNIVTTRRRLDHARQRSELGTSYAALRRAYCSEGIATNGISRASRPHNLSSPADAEEGLDERSIQKALDHVGMAVAPSPHLLSLLVALESGSGNHSNLVNRIEVADKGNSSVQARGLPQLKPSPGGNLIHASSFQSGFGSNILLEPVPTWKVPGDNLHPVGVGLMHCKSLTRTSSKQTGLEAGSNSQTVSLGAGAQGAARLSAGGGVAVPGQMSHHSWAQQDPVDPPVLASSASPPRVRFMQNRGKVSGQGNWGALAGSALTAIASTPLMDSINSNSQVFSSSMTTKTQVIPDHVGDTKGSSALFRSFGSNGHSEQGLRTHVLTADPMLNSHNSLQKHRTSVKNVAPSEFEEERSDVTTEEDNEESGSDKDDYCHDGVDGEEEGREGEKAGPDQRSRWHEVQALPVQDPVTGRDAVLLLQTDVTARAVMEMKMTALTEAQLTMLENMFPRHILEFVMGTALPQANLGDLARQHEQVTILFMDICGFTSMSKEVAPHLVMEFLNRLFSKFDILCDHYGVYKVETAGDCYIVAGALMSYDHEGFVSINPNSDPKLGATSILGFAKAMLRHAASVRMPHNGMPTTVRVGIHTGSVVSGLIGTKLPKFSLFGDTMNTSSRMESTSKPGCIQISESTYRFLDYEERSIFEATGGVEVKGKGIMQTYLYKPVEGDLSLQSEDLEIIEEAREEEEGLAEEMSESLPTWRVATSALAEAASELLPGRLLPTALDSSPRSFDVDNLASSSFAAQVSFKNKMARRNKSLPSPMADIASPHLPHDSANTSYVPMLTPATNDQVGDSGVNEEVRDGESQRNPCAEYTIQPNANQMTGSNTLHHSSITQPLGGNVSGEPTQFQAQVARVSPMVHKASQTRKSGSYMTPSWGERSREEVGRRLSSIAFRTHGSVPLVSESAQRSFWQASTSAPSYSEMQALLSIPLNMKLCQQGQQQQSEEGIETREGAVSSSGSPVRQVLPGRKQAGHVGATSRRRSSILLMKDVLHLMQAAVRTPSDA